MKNKLPLEKISELVFSPPSALQKQAASLYRNKKYMELLDGGLKSRAYWQKQVQEELEAIGITPARKRAILDEINKLNYRVMAQVFADTEGIEAKLINDEIRAMLEKVKSGTQSVRDVAALEMLKYNIYHEFGSAVGVMSSGGMLTDEDKALLEDSTRMANIENKYLELSVETNADKFERFFLIAECAYNSEGEKIFDNVDDVLSEPSSVVENLLSLWLAFCEAPDRGFLLSSLTKRTGV